MFGFESGEVEVYVNVEADDYDAMPYGLRAKGSSISGGATVAEMRVMWSNPGGITGKNTWTMKGGNAIVPESSRGNRKEINSAIKSFFSDANLKDHPKRLSHFKNQFEGCYTLIQTS